ncbi:MAG TPA: hypothetical protein VGB91_01320 [Rhizomicrobium sp.]
MARFEDIKLMDKAGLVRRADAPQLVWGDDECGFVPDLLHVSCAQMDLLAFRLPPGGRYTASGTNRAVYRTDVAMYVLQGQFTVQLPESGEVAVVEAGELMLLPMRSFHFGYNFSDRELWVIEAIPKVPPLPTPYTGTFPVPGLGIDARGLKDFPRSRPEAQAKICVIGRSAACNVILGSDRKVLMRVLASCENVSVAVFDLLAGQRSETFRCEKDATLYVERGRLHVRIAAEGLWDEMNPEDAFFLPAGCEWQVFNGGDKTASAHFALAGNFAANLTTV